MAEDLCESSPAMSHCRHRWDQRPRFALDPQLPILILWQTLPLSLTGKTLGSGWPVGVLIPTPGYMGAGAFLFLEGWEVMVQPFLRSLLLPGPQGPCMSLFSGL